MYQCFYVFLPNNHDINTKCLDLTTDLHIPLNTVFNPQMAMYQYNGAYLKRFIHDYSTAQHANL
jgi:hypothetical protein